MTRAAAEALAAAEREVRRRQVELERLWRRDRTIAIAALRKAERDHAAAGTPQAAGQLRARQMEFARVDDFTVWKRTKGL